MDETLRSRCRAALKRWLEFASENLLRNVPGHPELAYYGTGESAHWAVQSNMNVAAALAVAGVEESDPAMMERALSLFRYAMRTHVTGDLAATDNAQWGRHWISVLGAERMTHGVNALEPHFTGEDRERYRAFRFAEAEFLLREYPVKANMLNSSGENRPESNIWNGGFLWRAALDYPDASDAALWREKGTSFLLNGISHALDAASEQRFDGRPLREWHVGFNFTPNYSLDHHGYMNVGYSIICLSNLAMLHFNFRERGQNPPEALSLHVDDLWHTVKNFFFDDGRLLRIGGDTRARYTYCQCYALPALWLAADFLRDADAVRLRERYLELLFQEQDSNRDGSFYGGRLRGLREQSYYYYPRLESDPALVLSQELWWARLASLPEPAAEPLPASSWHDSFHGAYLLKNHSAVRSFVQRGAAGPVALCLPADRSDLAEWEGNLLCRIGLHRREARQGRSAGKTGADFFVHCGSVEWVEAQPYGEGEGHYPVAESRFAVAALPDGRSMLVLERVVVLKESTFDQVIPADMVDGNTKFYINPTGRFVIGGPHGDSGLTGRKIIVDTYGGMARHGGGAFSGKDCTKVDRSAAYAARYVAKNIVAAGLADKCEIQLSYAIGVARPTSINVDTFGTGKLPDSRLVEIIRENFDLRPAGIIRMLDLRRPIYKQTAAYGHFGRNDLDLPWEKLDKVEILKQYL